MADEKAPSKAQQFLFEHGEKVGLGVAVGLLVIYAVMGIALAEENQSAVAVRNNAAEIDRQAGLKHPNFTAPTLDEKSPLHDLTILDSWQTLPDKTEGASDWSVAIRTELEGKETFIPKATEKPVVVPAVSGFKAEPGIDGVKLTWTVSTPDDKEAEKATIESFTIERKNKSTNKTDKITEKNPKATSYLDKTAEKRGSYEYRITAHCKFSRGKKDSSPTGWVAATMIDEWTLAFINPQPGTVMIKIVKFDKEYGAVDVSKLHKEGQKIGVWEEELTRKVKNSIGEMVEEKYKADTGLHRASGHWVDFDTKCTLTKVAKFEAVVKWNKCKIKRGSGGETSCEGVEALSAKVDLIEIVYTDADNKPVSLKFKGGKEVQMLNATDLDPAEHPPAVTAERCEAHGGKKEEVDPKAEEKQKLEREAAKARGEAKAQQANWETLKKKAKKAEDDGKKEDATKYKQEAEKAKQAAVDKYKKWQEDYKDTDDFKRNNKQVEKDLKEITGG